MASKTPLKASAKSTSKRTKPAVKPPAFLAAVVGQTLDEQKQPDEFTLPEFMATAAELGARCSERSALAKLKRQVDAGLLTTRKTTVDGHYTRVWRQSAPPPAQKQSRRKSA